MSAFTLSYIIATRNRLPFLKITLEKLISILQPDEEIVVVDGNSTDGAKEYLQQLFEQGKIHQLVSEPDRNQAHGWNKAMLMAKGTIIKKIIDDDVHHYTAIRKCLDYMLNNPQIDICISNCLSTALLSPQNITEANRFDQYKKWKAGMVNCFTFSDISMLIRKSALSYLGLYDTQFAMMDWEYALRCSYLKADIVYYTGYNSLSVDTPGNVTSKTDDAKLKAEGRIGQLKYDYEGDRADISFYSEMKIAIGKIIFRKRGSPSAETPGLETIPPEELSKIYYQLYQYLENYSRATDAAFIGQ
jgi:glycosyltransferase involved in cell wall biosynthesis